MRPTFAKGSSASFTYVAALAGAGLRRRGRHAGGRGLRGARRAGDPGRGQRLFGRRVAHTARQRALLFLERLLNGHLQAQKRAQEVLVHGRRQVLEGAVRLVLVFHQGVALAERAQADARLQVVHLLEVRHPARVDDAQHHLGFQVAHDLLAQHGGLLLVHALQVVAERVGKPFRVVVVVGLGGSEVVLAGHVRRPQVHRLDVPVVARALLGAALAHHLVHRLAYDLGDAVGEVLAVQDGVALAVDGRALQVHDVVVFQHVLAGGEVHALHLALRAFDGLGNHAGLNGHVLGHVGLLHHAGDGVHAVAAEKPHEVVFQRQVELGGARVALAAGTAAQLVVDASRLVALGADDGEAAGFDHGVVLGGAHLLGLGQGRGAILVRGCRCAFLVGLGGVGRCRLVAQTAVRVEPALAQQVVGHDLGVAAKEDVGAAAGHVRGDGHGAHAARLRDDVRLALVVLRVQRLVLDAALVEQAREALGAFDGHGADEARLSRGMALGHVVGHGVELGVHRAVDEVVLVHADHRAVRRDGDDRQLVDLAELRVLGHGRARHAREASRTGGSSSAA